MNAPTDIYPCCGATEFGDHLGNVEARKCSGTKLFAAIHRPETLMAAETTCDLKLDGCTTEVTRQHIDLQYGATITTLACANCAAGAVDADDFTEYASMPLYYEDVMPLYDEDERAAAVAFFIEHGAASWNPAFETREQGALRGAAALAAAEEYAAARDWSHTVQDSGERMVWQGDSFDVITDDGDYDEVFIAFDVVAYASNGDVLASLGFVTFEDNDPDGDPYLRVVVAELFLEAMSEVVA